MKPVGYEADDRDEVPFTFAPTHAVLLMTRIGMGAAKMVPGAGIEPTSSSL